LAEEHNGEKLIVAGTPGCLVFIWKAVKSTYFRDRPNGRGEEGISFGLFSDQNLQFFFILNSFFLI